MTIASSTQCLLIRGARATDANNADDMPTTGRPAAATDPASE
jgi:hypothetical protein